MYLNLLCLEPDLIPNVERIWLMTLSNVRSAFAVYLSEVLPLHLYGGLGRVPKTLV